VLVSLAAFGAAPGAAVAGLVVVYGPG
jgi:hypothetical protein